MHLNCQNSKARLSLTETVALNVLMDELMGAIKIVFLVQLFSTEWRNLFELRLQWAMPSKKAIFTPFVRNSSRI